MKSGLEVSGGGGGRGESDDKPGQRWRTDGDKRAQNNDRRGEPDVTGSTTPGDLSGADVADARLVFRASCRGLRNRSWGERRESHDLLPVYSGVRASRCIAVIIWRGVGGGGSSLAPSLRNPSSMKLTKRRQASGAASPAPWTTPAFAMSSRTRSSKTKSGRRLPSAWARSTSWTASAYPRVRCASSLWASGNVLVSTSLSPRSAACIAQTRST